MAINTYVRGSAGDYQARHNKRELKTIETAVNAWSYGVSNLAAGAADYAVTSTDGYNVFIANDEITVTMPPAASSVGRRIAFSTTAAATFTVAQNADGADIAGANADYTALDAAGDTAEFLCNGVEWVLVGSTIA